MSNLVPLHACVEGLGVVLLSRLPKKRHPRPLQQELEGSKIVPPNG
jgi:hypothetical protein